MNSWLVQNGQPTLLFFLSKNICSLLGGVAVVTNKPSKRINMDQSWINMVSNHVCLTKTTKLLDWLPLPMGDSGQQRYWETARCPHVPKSQGESHLG